MNDILERLQESDARRRDIVKRFGFIPDSILKINRNELSKVIFHYGRENGINKSSGERAEKKGGLYATIKTLRNNKDRSTRDSNPQFLSIMPPELVDFFVSFYAEPGQTYLDPFMGQGVRMQVAKLRGMHYRGTDVSLEFTPYVQKVAKKIDDGKTVLQTLLCDARFPAEIPDGCGDFCFTSPPYWDIEKYGDEPEQLGIGKSYGDFLQGMEDVARAWLPKFKPGAFAVFNINDFRKDGRFYPYHSDLMTAFVRGGWEVWDTWIVAGLVTGLSRVYAGERISRKYAPKVHEYAVVFRAPGGAAPSSPLPPKKKSSIPALVTTGKPLGVKEAVSTLQAKLTPDLVHPKFKAIAAKNPRPYACLCALATEALFHVLGGREAGFRPFKIAEHEGTDHWFLRGPTGEIIDATVEQFVNPPPYESAKGTTFMTQEPSKRCRLLLGRAGLSVGSASAGVSSSSSLQLWLPPERPIVIEHGGVFVVRDDLYPGGTKSRYAAVLFGEGVEEVVYASPAQGGAQISLAAAAQRMGKRATLFVAKRKELHPATAVATALGAKVVEVPMGYLSHVQAKAKAYVENAGSEVRLAPFGFAIPGAEEEIAKAARAAMTGPDEVWCAASSGTLARGLALAFPKARRHVVQVGRKLDPKEVAGATIHEYRLGYEKVGPAAPFSCNRHYESKAWEVCAAEHGKGTVLFWNVIADSADILGGHAARSAEQLVGRPVRRA